VLLALLSNWSILICEIIISVYDCIASSTVISAQFN